MPCVNDTLPPELPQIVASPASVTDPVAVPLATIRMAPRTFAGFPTPESTRLLENVPFGPSHVTLLPISSVAEPSRCEVMPGNVKGLVAPFVRTANVPESAFEVEPTEPMTPVPVVHSRVIFEPLSVEFSVNVVAAEIVPPAVRPIVPPESV